MASLAAWLERWASGGRDESFLDVFLETGANRGGKGAATSLVGLGSRAAVHDGRLRRQRRRRGG
jgi:hypothetical protein